MSVVGITIEYSIGQETGPDVIDKMAVAFERAGANLEAFGKYVFPRLIPVFEAEEKRQFDAQGAGPNVGAWAALSEDYRKWKEKAFPGKPILEATGALRAALTSSSSPLALRDYTGSQFNFGTQGVHYASFHQLGTAHLPVRAPFDFTDALQREMQAAAMAGVREAIKDAGADKYLSEGAP